MELLEPTIAVYRVFDLAEAFELRRITGPRHRLLRDRGGAVHFENPPVTIDIGMREVGDKPGRLTARLYEFGVVALCWRTTLGSRVSWDDFLATATTLPDHPSIGLLFVDELNALEKQLGTAIVRPVTSRHFEEFTVFHVRSLSPVQPPAELLGESRSAELLLGDQGPFAPEIRKDLARYTFSYTVEDLAVLSFDRVLVVNPHDIWDVADLVEFAHAELVELTYYDRILTLELRKLPEVLRRRSRVSARKLKHLRQRFMGLHAEITDIHNRLRGSLKVTEDLFYARIYRSAMELYGVREIDELIGERLQVLTETYAMISDEVRYLRSHLLEVAIFLLILIEVINTFIH